VAVLTSRSDPDSEESRSNRAVMEALVEDLRTRTVYVTAPGPQAWRRLFLARITRFPRVAHLTC